MQCDGLVEQNRLLRLDEASLRDPQRIDALARQLGLQSPQAGQVIRMDSAAPESVAPVMASMTPVAGFRRNRQSPTDGRVPVHTILYLAAP